MTKHNNCDSGTGIKFMCDDTESEKNATPLSQEWIRAPIRTLNHYGDGTDTSRSRLFLRLQATLLPFLAPAWMNLTQTLSCLNWTRNLQDRTEQLGLLAVTMVTCGRTGVQCSWCSCVKHLLVWDVDTDRISFHGRGSCTMEFGNDFY